MKPVMKLCALFAVNLLVVAVSSFPASAETLKDRCSGSVRIPPSFSSGSHVEGTVVLLRSEPDSFDFTDQFQVQVNKSDCCTGNIYHNDCGKFRWYCRPKGDSEWVKEQSRCKGKDSILRAKLGSDRLVQFECLGGGFDPDCDNNGGGGGGSAGNKCKEHDICAEGTACNLSTKNCDKIDIEGCGDLGEECCPPTSADPIGCGGTRQCSGGVCQHCGGDNQLCCGGANVAGGGCDPAFECSGGFCAEKTGSSKDAIKAQDQENPDIAVAYASGQLQIIERDGGRFTRMYSFNNGDKWYFKATQSSEGLLTADNQIGQGEFTSAPAIAESADGKLVHVIGRGTDNRFWRAYSPDGGNSWTVAWVPIGQGLFTSAPAAAVSADGKHLHIFGRGKDNKFWRAYSPDSGRTWSVAWQPIGEGVFTSAPAAAISADGKQLHVFGRGNDQKIWRAYSPDGGRTWTVAWVPIGEGVFTSAPAAAVSANGKELHVFGRGKDNKFWRAFSSDRGQSWSVAWAPIGEGVFSSGPSAAISANGKSVHLFGRGLEAQGTGFQVAPKIWRAFSSDGGKQWAVAWTPIEATGQRFTVPLRPIGPRVIR